MILLLIVVSAVFGQITPVPREITPVPRRNPREKEFQNLDSDGDGQVTFTEFLLNDKPYIEHASKNFYKFDDNGDSSISKDEFDAYYTKLDEERRHEEKNRENFFNHFNRPQFSSAFFDFPMFNNRQGPSASTANETLLSYPEVFFS